MALLLTAALAALDDSVCRRDYPLDHGPGDVHHRPCRGEHIFPEAEGMRLIPLALGRLGPGLFHPSGPQG